MKRSEERTTQQFRKALVEEYGKRFPRSQACLERYERSVLDHTSHAIRWNEPFMPVVAKADGPIVEDLDGHRLVDYWQGHFANILGHNPPLIRETLAAALREGRGLQTGMLHEVEGEVAELLCRRTNTETLRLTTSGSLGTFYAVVLARAFTGRELVLKVSGGWHGSQPFGLKGVAPHGESFDHLESEGLSSSVGTEIVLTRFNDVEGLRDVFARMGDNIACFLIEPVMGSGGGMAASSEYLAEARRLTEQHGALLLCDEIITGFRFRAGDLTSTYGIRPDLLILGKVVGGGMPVAAVAGRRDVLSLSCRKNHRVKFEGGTFSAHELSLIATRTIVRHLIENEDEIYSKLSALGDRMREGIARVAGEAGVPIHTTGSGISESTRGSLVFAHVMREGATVLDSPDALAAGSHPLIDERLFKATLLLENVSTRSGLGGISTAHTVVDLDRTLEGFRAALARFKDAGLY